MKLVLPLPPNLANARLHWAQKLRVKKRYYRDADERQLVGLVPPPPPEPMRSAVVSVHLHVHNRLDKDNLYARLKYLLDWLVTRGYLANDDPDTIRDLMVRQSIERSDKRAEVTLQEAS